MDRLRELKDRFIKEPFVTTLRARLIRLEPGEADVVCTPESALTVAGGIVQGGATASLADFAGVYAAMSAIPSGHTPATSMTLSFLRPVMEGEEVLISAKVVNTSRTRILTSVTVTVGVALKAVAIIEFARPRVS